MDAEQQLTEMNVEEVLKGLKVKSIPLLRQVIAAISQNSARRLSRRVLDFDARVGQQGFQTASRWLLEQFTREVIVHGAEHIPQNVPLLITSNHPGQTDAFAVAASISRPDLRLVASERDLIDTLPNTRRFLIMVPQSSQQRQQAVREITAYLRSGGAILTFPAGQIEPDPALRQSAFQWSQSIGLLTHLVPNLQLLPVMVSGVLSQDALRHPLISLYKDPKQREWVAAVLQTLIPRYQNVTVNVVFGEAIRMSKEVSRVEVTRQMTAKMRELAAKQAFEG